MMLRRIMYTAVMTFTFIRTVRHNHLVFANPKSVRVLSFLNVRRVFHDFRFLAQQISMLLILTDPRGSFLSNAAALQLFRQCLVPAV